LKFGREKSMLFGMIFIREDEIMAGKIRIKPFGDFEDFCFGKNFGFRLKIIN